MPQNPSWKHLLRHPLFILVMGAVLTSLIFPHVSDLNTRSRLREEQTQKTAISILQNAAKTERLLNRALTTLEQFEKDAAVRQWKRDELAKRQLDLEGKFSAQYEQIDDLAWWWPWDAYNEAEIVHFYSNVGQKEFSVRIQRYDELLTQTADALFALRDELLAVSYDPGTIENVKKRIAGLRKKLDLLRDERFLIAGKLCDIVTAS